MSSEYIRTKCNPVHSALHKLFSCDQAGLQMLFSVCLSVRLSVHLSHLFHPHHINMKFSGVIPNDKSKVYAKGQKGQRSKVKVTEVKTQLHRFRTVTPVWIHIWWWNDAHSLMFLRRGAPLVFFRHHFLGHPSNFKVTRLNKSSNLTQIGRFRTVTPVWIHQWLRNDTKLEVAQKRCPIVFQCHRSNFEVTRLKKSSILTQIGRFRTATPVWIHQWLWNVAQSLKQHRRGAPMFFKVIRQISRSHG